MATRAVASRPKQESDVRKQLHRLVGQLPPSEVHAARRYLEYLRDEGDPLLKKLLNAPLDDEPITAEEKQAVHEGWEEYRRGKTRRWEEVRRELRGG